MARGIDLIGSASCRGAPVPVDFRVCLIARGREWDAGRLTVPRGESDEHYFNLDSEEIPGFMDAVKEDPWISVVLRPVGPAKLGGEAVWDEEVWFPEVVVEWYWY